MRSRPGVMLLILSTISIISPLSPGSALTAAAQDVPGSSAQATPPLVPGSIRSSSSLDVPATPAQTVPEMPIEPELAELQKELIRIAAPIGGEVGVTAIQLETRRRVALNSGDRFPMGSTFKLPLAVYVLARKDSGEEQLDRLVPIRRSDLRPFSSLKVTSGAASSGVSIRKLLEIMMIDSDNTAADVLLGTIGGPAVLTAWLKAQGLSGFDVSRSEGQMALDVNGAKFPPGEEWTLEMFETLKKGVPPAEKAAALHRFEADPRDTASPDAMAALLVQLAEGKLLKPETNAWLLETMKRCKTGDRRLRALLPAGSVVAEKTGTIARSTNDVGIIWLPGGSRVVVAVYVKLSNAEFSARERVIAEIGRVLYDFFLHP